ncbi:MAG: PSD1 and planctomycete cytochrome C domain-containing protein [Gemmataceae bacterium]|nr:PSD1 and planctomycete cytochrome C domain-containing protein [Gemmata sp.]MDW8196232.1 PSD1 and planctomycete cytochrome C domain-containing protein [Gemmataceae bacterium]
MTTFIPSIRGLVAIAGWVLLPAVGRADEVDYLKQVKPLLEARCYACHGALKQNGKLRLDTVAAALTGGSSGPAIVKGKPDQSELIARVSAQDPAERMPPEHEGSPLTAAEINLLRQWIQAGAPHPADEKPEPDPRQHWAFQPIQRPPVPKVNNAAWVRNPIDAFVAQQHERRGLTPQPEANREILLRRLSLDLLGVPPTPEEIAAIQADQRPDWYERLVDRLLNDPRYGERWGRHWMDIWRYSDWWGLGNELRNSQKHIWHWRDWIIESLNKDVPYDEMIRQMLAADELYPHDLSKLRATGFLARNYFLFNRHQWMDETVEHVSKAFLGLTMNCVRCHDHKYDPFPQISYYQLRAFFEPYHVRLDVVPGEPNLERNGIPRVFDAWPDAPTYRFIRGDEKNPDKSQTIAPGLPKVLTPELPKIQPVDLPPDAWQPQRRAWVIPAYLNQAQHQLMLAEKTLAKIDAQLARLQEASADRSSPPPPPPSAAGTNQTGVFDTFAKLDPKRWQKYGGEWQQQGESIEQKHDGSQRAVLRLLEKAPRDFDATVRFTLQGGRQWRSLGLSFDAADGDPTQDTAATYHEQLVYVSAFADGPKIHAAYNVAGQWHYPPAPAMRPLPIQLHREYTLRIQVRDRTINASINGVPVLACQTSQARRAGHLQIVTFDARAVVHEFRLQALDPKWVLLDPDSPQLQGEPLFEVDDVRAERAVAAAAVAVARAEVKAIERRGQAWQAIWSQAGDNEQRTAHAAAIRAARELKVAQAQHALAVAQRNLRRAPADQQAAAAKAVESAQTALQHAQAAVSAAIAPTEKLEEFVGARWTPTRFLSSTADDPAPAFLPRSTGRRTALAQWITDPRNPLTARVAVNHIWNRHFGTPLVPTVFDFGRKGQPPTHPELLDWLASELVAKGWSMKHLHRLIVQSATYRLASSTHASENRSRDPDNVYLWRRTPVRMESQVVRDSLLSLAGQLDPQMGGPPVPPAEQAQSKRRSIYFFHSNNERNLFLTTFDEALVTDCYRREQSIVPQQALAMTNSRWVLDVCRPIAERLSQWLRTQPSAESDAAFVRAAFLVLLAHTPTERELQACLQALAAWRKLPEAGRDETATNFAYAQLIWVLLNHNDFIMIR